MSYRFFFVFLMGKSLWRILYMIQSFSLFHLSKLSVQNFRFYLFMYPESVPRRPVDVGCWCPQLFQSTLDSAGVLGFLSHSPTQVVTTRGWSLGLTAQPSALQLYYGRNIIENSHLKADSRQNDGLTCVNSSFWLTSASWNMVPTTCLCSQLTLSTSKWRIRRTV